MIAPHAELAPDGRVYVLSGDLDTIRIQGQLPGLLPIPLYFIAKIALTAEEAGREHTSRIEFIGPDGLIEAVDQKPRSEPVKAGRQSKLGVLLAIGGVPLPRAGDYAFRLVFDDKEVIKLPLAVIAESNPGKAND